MGLVFELYFEHLQIGEDYNSTILDYIICGQRSKLKEEKANRC